ncbi:MAG: hypothetical protein J6S02_08525 [Bacteroidaceae bacterium]|nr:hypothetical protein [Bacteroidaceae bacterium]
MKKIYVTPTLEVFEYIPEGQLLTSSDLNVGFGGDGEELEDGWTNKREPEAPWGKSPWE